MKTCVLVILFALMLISGCTSVVKPQALAENPLVKLTAIDESGLFAADPNGTKVALVKKGLYLFDLDSTSSHKLSSDQPNALAWSPDGSTLAVAVSGAEYATRVLLYSAHGELIRDVLLPAALTQLTWSARGDLLATGIVLKAYSFGGNLRQSLYRIEADRVVETLLTDTTLRPALVASIGPLIRRFQTVAFSPDGDELVFLSLHDPPEFTPYLQLMHRNWQSGQTRPLQKTTLHPVLLFWDESGDMIDVVSEHGDQPLDLWPSDRTENEQSSTHAYRFVAGKLYSGGELLADWGANARLQILADGRFLLAVQKSLYLGSALKSVQRYHSSEKLWNLRRWRFEGLISQQEYLNLLEEMNK